VPRLAVLGYPVGHSRSPAMHNAALAALGMDDEWSYEAIEVAPEGFAARVGEMTAEGFAGANVTIPHKEAALALAAVPSEAAREIGAANTLIFGPFAFGRPLGDQRQRLELGPDAEGGIAAENTDAGGLLAALPTTPLDARALVLGAGGAARAAVWALAGEGARVDVWNRTATRAHELCRELGGRSVDAPAQGDYDLIVNTTSVGLGGEDPFEELPLDAAGFVAGQAVVDMVYGERSGALLGAAEAAGATTIDGLEILVQQGALSFEIWTGRKPPLDVMRAAARGE
jgi:shikimate dehydrogenase